MPMCVLVFLASVCMHVCVWGGYAQTFTLQHRSTKAIQQCSLPNSNQPWFKESILSTWLLDCKGQRSKCWAYTGSSSHLSVCDKCVCSCPVCLSVSLSLSLSEVTKGQSLPNSHVLITHFQTSPCVFSLSFSTRQPAPGLRQVPDNLNPCPLVAVRRGSVEGVIASRPFG